MEFGDNQNGRPAVSYEVLYKFMESKFDFFIKSLHIENDDINFRGFIKGKEYSIAVPYKLVTYPIKIALYMEEEFKKLAKAEEEQMTYGSALKASLCNSFWEKKCNEPKDKCPDFENAEYGPT